jgi:membrane-bound lytic murein transglycosylase B
VANGRKTSTGQPGLRASAPHQDGPLGSSGAAPEAAPAQKGADATAPPAPEPTTPEPTALEPTALEPTALEPTASMPAAAEPTAAIAKSDTSEKSEAPTDVAQAAGAEAKTDVPADSARTKAAPTADAKTEAAPTADAKTEAAPTDSAKTEGKTETLSKAGDTAKPATGPASDPKATPPAPRRAHPVRAVARAGRSTSAWAKRPSGRLVLPGVIALLLLGAAGTAGAYLVPQALDAAPAPSATPGFAGAATAASAPPVNAPAGLPTGSAPVGASGAPAVTTPPAQGQFGQAGQRPADALAGWAEPVGTKVSIPVVALEAYGYAELVLARTTPSCHLSWTTIAALAKVESDHGSANGAVLGADGGVQPPIYGLPLDGKGGRQLVRDTDQGVIDGDTTYDRAVGPLQFIPQTWNSNKIDADNNGVADPNDIDDASLTAASYLCQGGRDLSKAESWWDAILSYNAVQPYAQKVFEAANDYGQRSRG